MKTTPLSEANASRAALLEGPRVQVAWPLAAGFRHRWLPWAGTTGHRRPTRPPPTQQPSLSPRPTGWAKHRFSGCIFLRKEKNNQNRIPLPGTHHFLANHKFWQNLLYITVVQFLFLQIDTFDLADCICQGVCVWGCGCDRKRQSSTSGQVPLLPKSGVTPA